METFSNWELKVAYAQYNCILPEASGAQESSFEQPRLVLLHICPVFKQVPQRNCIKMCIYPQYSEERIQIRLSLTGTLKVLFTSKGETELLYKTKTFLLSQQACTCLHHITILVIKSRWYHVKIMKNKTNQPQKMDHLLKLLPETSQITPSCRQVKKSLDRAGLKNLSLRPCKLSTKFMASYQEWRYSITRLHGNNSSLGLQGLVVVVTVYCSIPSICGLCIGHIWYLICGVTYVKSFCGSKDCRSNRRSVTEVKTWLYKAVFITRRATYQTMPQSTSGSLEILLTSTGTAAEGNQSPL